MNDKMRIAGFIEKPLEYDPFLGRQALQCRMCGPQVLGKLGGSHFIQTLVVFQPLLHVLRAGRQFFFEFPAQLRHRLRQFITTPRRLAKPEWDIGRPR